jgi:hypothetical protein
MNFFDAEAMMTRVEWKLAHQIIPYLVKAKYLRRQWFWIVGQIYLFGNDALTAIASIGLSSPIFAAARRLPAGGEAQDDFHWAEYLAEPAGRIGLAALLLWAALKVAVNRYDVVARCSAVKSCQGQLRSAALSLDQTLDAGDPMPQLNRLYSERIYPVADRAVLENIWPEGDHFDNGRGRAEIDAWVKRLVLDFGDKWTGPSDPDLRL